MGNEFDFIPRVERGECSLAELVHINYRMEEVIGKRRRTMWIILGVLAAIALALAAYVAFGLLNPRAGSHDRQFTLILGGVSLAAMLAFAPAIGIALHRSTLKPAKSYRDALQAGYPGIDASSEAAMKSYVWNYADDPRKLLGNLSALIERTGGQRWVRGEAARGQHTPAEQVVLDLWQYAPEPYHELYDLQMSGDSEMEYLANVVNSFNAIGATEEADAWLEIRELFGELVVWDGEGEFIDEMDAYDNDIYWKRYRATATGKYLWVWDFDEYDGDCRAFTEDQHNRFLDLERRVFECRPDTNTKLYEFVLQNRILLGFDEVGQAMQTPR